MAGILTAASRSEEEEKVRTTTWNTRQRKLSDVHNKVEVKSLPRNQRFLQSDGIVLLGRSHFFAVSRPLSVNGIGRIPCGIQPGSQREEVFYTIPRSRVSCLFGTSGEGSMVNVRWLWIPLVGASFSGPAGTRRSGSCGRLGGDFSPRPW